MINVYLYMEKSSFKFCQLRGMTESGGLSVSLCPLSVCTCYVWVPTEATGGLWIPWSWNDR